MSACYIDPTNVLSWDALLPYVMPYCRGVPDQIALHHIRLSTIEFCRRTGILHDVQKYYLQAYVNNYQLVTDPNYDIARVIRVTVDKRWNYAPLNSQPPQSIGAFMYYMISPTIMQLRRPPAIDDPQGLEVETAVTPKQDSCVLDNYLYQQWAEGIAAGAIDRILSIPQTNWFDLRTAQKFELKYRKELTRARATVDRAFSPTSMMKTQPFVGPGNRAWGNAGNPWGNC